MANTIQLTKRKSILQSQSSSPITAKPRMNVVAQYLIALAAVISCYSAYVKFAVPIIEGPPNKVVRRTAAPIDELPSSGQQKSHLIPLLPPGSWELAECKTLVTASGTILFNDIDRLDDDSIRIVPFTMITGSKNNSKKTATTTPKNNPSKPIILRCIEGANLKFDKPMSDLFSGEAEMESAQLKGTVDIYGPPSRPGKNDAVHVLTRNVQFDKQRIYTLEEVVFSFGPNRGRGRNLLIDLSHENKPRKPEDFSSIRGARRIELAFLDKLRIEPAAGNTHTDGPGHSELFASSPAGGKQLFSNAKSPLEISCDGPFVFDLESKTAAFHENVLVQQVDAFKDHIKCQKFTLIFQDKPDGNPTESNQLNGKMKSNDPLNSNVHLKHFVAEGTPAVVVSRSKSAKLTGDYLSYDVAAGKFEGRSGRSEKSLVTMVNPEYQLVSKQLSFVVPDDKSPGTINANGPGRLLRLGSADRDEFFATWKKSLKSNRMSDQTGRQRVVVDGEARIRMGDDTRISADRLEVIAWQSPAESTDKDGAVNRTWIYRPSRLVANGNVDIISPDIDGRAVTLTAIWPEPDNPLSSHGRNSIASTDTHRVAFRGTNQQRSFAPVSRAPSSFQEQTTSKNSGGFQEQIRGTRFLEKKSVRQATFEDVAKPQRKLRFSGQTVDAQLVEIEEETRIQDLMIVGKVSIVATQIQSESGLPGIESLKITGHRLQLTPQSGKDNYRTLVSGTQDGLATVSAKQFQLTGQNINLDQLANKLWVEGAGSMNLDVARLDNADNRAESKASTLTQTDDDNANLKNLDVTWQGGMIFDGIKIYFERGVAMTAQRINASGDRSRLHSLSEGISLELKQPFAFNEPEAGKKRGKAEIREVVFVDHVPEAKQAFRNSNPTSRSNAHVKRPVVIENETTDSTGQRLERQRITVPQAILDVERGSIQSKGPGTISTHRMDRPSNEGAPNPFGRLGKTNNTTGLSFIRINFDGPLNIESSRGEMEIRGNIRTVYAPIQNWQEELDPDKAKKGYPESIYLTCEKLQMAQWSPRGKTEQVSELIASGNAHITSQSFQATADRVSFDQASEWLTIEGTPRTDANLWFKQTPNDKNPTHLVAEKIKYRAKDGMTETQGVKNLNINRN